MASHACRGAFISDAYVANHRSHTIDVLTLETSPCNLVEWVRPPTLSLSKADANCYGEETHQGHGREDAFSQWLMKQLHATTKKGITEK